MFIFMDCVNQLLKKGGERKKKMYQNEPSHLPFPVKWRRTSPYFPSYTEGINKSQRKFPPPIMSSRFGEERNKTGENRNLKKPIRGRPKKLGFSDSTLNLGDFFRSRKLHPKKSSPDSEKLAALRHAPLHNYIYLFILLIITANIKFVIIIILVNYTFNIHVINLKL